jgi:eukaryotic-like serine/threonine-protein kinase
LGLDKLQLQSLRLPSTAARVLSALPQHTWEQAPDVTIRPDAEGLRSALNPHADAALDASPDATLDAPTDLSDILSGVLSGDAPQTRGPSLALYPASPEDVEEEEWLPRLSIIERTRRLDTSGAFASAPCDFEVIDELGRGGMGIVQRAHQRTLRREVALKRAKLAVQGAGALLHEARITGGLEHPHIIPVHALGLDQQQHPVLVMKRVEGVVWRALIQDPQHPWWAKLAPGADHLSWHIERLMQVCDAVAFAHERGVIHRDLKPDNVMIGAFGEVYVLDWGVALALEEEEQAARSGRSSARFSFVGTPAYMAPEMVNAEPPVSTRSDVYLLGAILYEVITAEPPHRGKTMLEVLLSASQGQEPVFAPGQAHPALAALCARAMRAHPDDRFSTVLELKRALRDHLQRRAAHRLVERADGLLQALSEVTTRAPQHSTLLDAHHDTRPDTRPPAASSSHQAQRLFIECRFALQQALSENPGDPSALASLERALTLMIDAELGFGHVAAARALLADLPSPRADLTQKVEAAEAVEAAARAELSALRDLAHGMDNAVSSKQRGMLMSGLALFWGALIVAAVAAVHLLDYTPTYPHAMSAAVGGLLMALVGMYALRRAFRSHRLNRLVMWIVSTIVAAATLLRALFWHLNVPLLTALNMELIAVALATLVGAITLDKRLIPPSLLCMLCGVLGVLVPPLSPEAYALGQFGALLWIAHIWSRSAHPQAQPPASHPASERPT